MKSDFFFFFFFFCEHQRKIKSKRKIKLQTSEGLMIAQLPAAIAPTSGRRVNWTG